MNWRNVIIRNDSKGRFSNMWDLWYTLLHTTCDKNDINHLSRESSRLARLWNKLVKFCNKVESFYRLGNELVLFFSNFSNLLWFLNKLIHKEWDWRICVISDYNLIEHFYWFFSFEINFNYNITNFIVLLDLCLYERYT